MEFNIQKQTINNKLIDTVNGRELQDRLENTTNHATWIKLAIEAAYLVEGKDYVTSITKLWYVPGRNIQVNYWLTFEACKAIGMMQQSQIGKDIRDYFTNLEEPITEAPSKEYAKQYTGNTDQKYYALADIKVKYDLTVTVENLRKMLDAYGFTNYIDTTKRIYHAEDVKAAFTDIVSKSLRVSPHRLFFNGVVFAG